MSEETQAVQTGDEGQEPNVATEQFAGSENTQWSVDKLPVGAQAYIEELRKENAKHRRAKKTAESATKKAEEDRLADQQEWQQLAETRLARVTELEPLETLVTGYRETIEGMLTSKVKTLDGKGDRATKAVGGLPGELDAKAKLDWLNANEALFATAPPPNIGATERGRETGDINFTDEQVSQYAAEMNIDPRFVDRRAMAADLQARAQGAN